tara:strand:+ start:1138 stop:1404 length:267 start_codon:yes stop_codon:yes gene_type:complete
MSEYDEVVERQRTRLEAEKWGRGVRSIHGHSMDSMYYDNRPQDTADGKTVVDTEFNDGTVERTLDNGKIILFGKKKTTEELLDIYTRN